MYLQVGTHISWHNEPSVPFTSGCIADLCGSVPGDHTYISMVNVVDSNGTWWEIQCYNIIDSSMSGVGSVSTVNIDEYSLGNAISQGIQQSGLGQVNLMSDNAAMYDIANKLQELIDKDKPKETTPVKIPKVEDKYLIL